MGETFISNPPAASRIIEGMRDTGYDFNMAVADIIDNSIAADASRVIVHIDRNPVDGVRVSIADNGSGMDQGGLVNAMRYGSAERPDAASLGKFGLGLKTASTAFCRKLSLVSRSVGGSSLRKVCWDLDYIAQVEDWKLLQLDPTEEDEELLTEAAGQGPGTLVTWEKVDRLFSREYKSKSGETAAFNRYVESLKHHAALVYARYLDQGLSIVINGIEIEPYDPFCRSEEATEMLQKKQIIVSPEGEDDEATFTIRAWLIPRKDQFSTPEAAKEARVGNDTQGFYIYRENRLIHAGGWLGMFRIEPHFTLLRVEMDFDHRADDYLHVDIKKSRILLSEEIFDYIKNVFLQPPRREAEKRYRNQVRDAVKEKGDNPHAPSSRTIDQAAPNIEQSVVEIIDKNKGEVLIKNNKGGGKRELAIRELMPDSQGGRRVSPVDSLDGNVLWEPALVDGCQAVEINRSHPFYERIYYPLIDNPTAVQGLDFLLWSLATTEYSLFNSNEKRVLEDYKASVSKCLKGLVAEMPEPDVDGDD